MIQFSIETEEKSVVCSYAEFLIFYYKVQIYIKKNNIYNQKKIKKLYPAEDLPFLSKDSTERGSNISKFMTFLKKPIFCQNFNEFLTNLPPYRKRIQSSIDNTLSPENLIDRKRILSMF